MPATSAGMTMLAISSPGPGPEPGRCRCGRVVVGLGRLIHAFDLGLGAQFGHQLSLRLANHEILDLRLYFLELGRLLHALVFDFDHVPTELGFHRVGDLPVLQLEGGLGEFRHHLVLAEIAEIATIGFSGRVFGHLARNFGKIFALLQPGDYRLDLVLGFLAGLLVTRSRTEQDVAGMDFLFFANLFDRIFVDLVHGIVGEGVLADRLQQTFHEQFLAGKFGLALELGRVAEFLVLRGLRHQDHVGDKLDQVVLLGFRRHRRDLSSLFFSDGEVALMDFDTIDLGDQGVLVLGIKRGGRDDQQRQAGRE